MNKIIPFIVTLFLIPLSSSWALTKPLYSLAFNQDYSRNTIENSQLVIFDNGLLNFETNAGGWGLCTRNEVGLFEGQWKTENLKQFAERVSKLEKDCSKIQGCSLNFSQKEGQGLVTLDIFGKNSKTLYLDDQLFKDYFKDFIGESFFQNLKAKFGLVFEVNKGKFVLKKLGQEKLEIKFPSSLDEYTLNGESKKTEFKIKDQVLDKKELSLNFKSSLKNAERFVFTIQMKASNTEDKVYHLCTFSR